MTPSPEHDGSSSGDASSGREDASDRSETPASHALTSRPTGAVASGDPTTIVGIGASAGGLEAIEKFFDAMPADSGMVFVIIQHLSPDFKSLMDELLARHTSMAIHRVEHEMHVEPNNIYLIPPKKNMVISHGQLLLTEQDSATGLNLPIDIFFRSLAIEAREHAIAVVLSGTGSDGSRGLVDVSHAGGLVVAQDVQSSAFDGMPRNAMATGCVKLAAAPGELPRLLLQHLSDPKSFENLELADDIPLQPGGELAAIFRIFARKFGIDFTFYREKTIHRRIERRLQLTNTPDLMAYVRRLMTDAREIDLLYRDLLVEVTQFFRDPQAFERIRQEVIPHIFSYWNSTREEIRVWVPGCATGEEAYTIAILISEKINQLDLATPPVVKIFATDVHRDSLEIAGAGVYTSEAIATIPPDLRVRYFTQHGTLFHVTRALRQKVIFAPHDITKDPPFTKVDLISCRNVLIYLTPDVQRRVLSLFHFGLRVGGTLILGPSETVGDLAAEFETVDQHWRIFRKLRDVRLPEASNVRVSSPLFDVVNARPGIAGAPVRTPDFLERTVMDDLLDRYVPPSFLVNSKFELLHSFGEARKLLVQPKGRPTLELLKLVDGELRMAMTAALHRASNQKEPVAMHGVRMETDNGTNLMTVSAEPYQKRIEELYLISIVPMETPTRHDVDAEPFRPDDQTTQRIVDLERELEFTKESLQTTVEELESSNEELQSTNEELLAANEELQSTNEELHSVNEELYTVNAEHQRKINELSQLTADLDNLMRSTEIGTVFLDRELRIRRFTPAIASVFNILEQDIGRPIDQFAYHFEQPGWIDDARSVMEEGEPTEVEVRTRNADQVYLKRMRPYRESDNSVTGVVITFTDVTAIARAEQEKRYRQHLERIARDMQDFVYAVSHDLQGPMRQIRECVELLGDKLLVDNLPPEIEGVDKLMDAARTRTVRMERMMRHLLEYSRVNTRGRKLMPTPLDAVMDDVLAQCQNQIEESQAVITTDSLPSVRGDRNQLHTVFWHLLDNSLKYCNRRDKPEVHVGLGKSESDWLISVKDNGVGIDKRRLDDIFTIFRRLDVNDVPGDGVGLALCRRIMERHGGEIWAESSPGGTEMLLKFPVHREARS